MICSWLTVACVCYRIVWMLSKPGCNDHDHWMIPKSITGGSVSNATFIGTFLILVQTRILKKNFAKSTKIPKENHHQPTHLQRKRRRQIIKNHRRNYARREGKRTTPRETNTGTKRLMIPILIARQLLVITATAFSIS